MKMKICKEEKKTVSMRRKVEKIEDQKKSKHNEKEEKEWAS